MSSNNEFLEPSINEASLFVLFMFNDRIIMVYLLIQNDLLMVEMIIGL